ncbi:hypothetical protein [Lacibacter sediminis]|uniref:Uncharacterized protein n=1 Tax=Lacibacter sediminis TaxID=2760713 RepID=A0A7G5XBT5_9BACT|nr:hypothetical protein [Lacibacter sediminis]QNA42938.1 hypothetical protein H4075_12645 [Lacibacter sediminis]
MKKIFISMLFISICISISAQLTEPVHKLTKQDYLQKSKNQKTTGRVLLVGGTAMIVAGAVVGSTFEEPKGVLEIFSKGEVIGFCLFMAGAVVDLASIPFFISSAKNARKAATITLSNQQINVPNSKSLVVKSIPSVTLKIRL